MQTFLFFYNFSSIIFAILKSLSIATLYFEFKHAVVFLATPEVTFV